MLHETLGRVTGIDHLTHPGTARFSDIIFDYCACITIIHGH